MKRIITYFVLLTISVSAHAQATFKAGWNNYQTGMIIHEYTYNYTFTDSVRLFLTDSSIIYATADSMVTDAICYHIRDNAVYKSVNFFNSKKQVLKTEEYKDDNLQQANEWRYDDKGRKIFQSEDNKLNGNNYKKNYDYATDKKTGETIVTETAYYNGKIEFYTKSYYDKNAQKTKEVRLNDNNKDIIHIENYTYGENGKVKERSVYFPEFKVTKKFQEHEGDLLPKCFKSMPMGTNEKINIHTRISFVKRFMTRMQPVIFDKDCDEFEYKFNNGTNCEIFVSSTKVNNVKKLIFRLKDKV